MPGAVLTEGSELPWFKEKEHIKSVTVLTEVSVKRKELLVDTLAPSIGAPAECKSLSGCTCSWTAGRLIKNLSPNIFSHTFHYVTHYTDPDPTIDTDNPCSLCLTDTCRKLDFERCQDLHTNMTGLWGCGWSSHELACKSYSSPTSCVLSFGKKKKKKRKEMERLEELTQ